MMLKKLIQDKYGSLSEYSRQSGMSLDVIKSYTSGRRLPGAAKLLELSKDLNVEANKLWEMFNYNRSEIMDKMRLQDDPEWQKGVKETEKRELPVEHGVGHCNDIHYQWSAGEVCFDCPCGEKEIIICESGETKECECGRIYRLHHFVSCKNG